jgi:hypothetical protein
MGSIIPKIFNVFRYFMKLDLNVCLWKIDMLTSREEIFVRMFWFGNREELGGKL